ncbi:helix-turn-helix transcriptional regulator [Fredinandcohnia sp. FSL W7-1320]|uniref:helix-turn-helix transcriptional regulator n=1 Tax=Fredinandcohnia sp. FSL W7-1320 TaxID=2954540 RepID=UPI0030FDC48D
MSDVKTGLRLLALKEIFIRDTGEDSELSIKELVEKLQIAIPGCTADSKAIKRYINTLRESGFDIIENPDKYGKKYYSHQVRLFETYQLRLLVDPILSARFITTEEKKKIINNVKRLTSENTAKTLPDPIVYQQSINHDYQRIKHHIDAIHHAIYDRKMITFQYGDVDISKDFRLRHGGELYYIQPYALIWESNFYYLIGEDIKYSDEKNPRNYRLDRMRNVSITDKSFTRKQLDLSTHVQNQIHMFGGQDDWITLQFSLKQDVLNGVIDKFGIDADIRKGENETFILKVKAKLSKGLKGWILGWGSQVRVLSPVSLINDIKEETQKMIQAYKK